MKKLAMRVASYSALGGSACAIAGAALMTASGADLDRAIARNSIEEYLVSAGASSGLLVANLSLWIVMAVLMGVAGTAMAELAEGRELEAQLARFFYWAGVPLVLAAYVAWLAIVVRIAPDTSPASIQVSEAVGWFASRADWIATILIIGVGPWALSLSGRGSWVPGWLARWGSLAAFSGLLTAIAILTGGAGLLTYGFAIIPVGVGWMIAAGIVLLRTIRDT